MSVQIGLVGIFHTLVLSRQQLDAWHVALSYHQSYAQGREDLTHLSKQ